MNKTEVLSVVNSAPAGAQVAIVAYQFLIPAVRADLYDIDPTPNPPFGQIEFDPEEGGVQLTKEDLIASLAPLPDEGRIWLNTPFDIFDIDEVNLVPGPAIWFTIKPHFGSGEPSTEIVVEEPSDNTTTEQQ